MKRLLAMLAVVLPALSVSAEEAPKPNHGAQQEHGEYGPVPNPVPVGYPYCVTVVKTPEYREKYGVASVYRPPQDRIAAGALNFARREGIAILVHCNEESA
ncbi:hypothetical protein [Pelagibius sp. Alg239-R121]|uniref:hypothetical protein n=1 Tax=Pelagibius sp. Alg239-R121 TaxID=2993448 RepID=UPI0024A70F9C|nr:hypothetical protein [Pelagibius sp. Alg239-R121]